MIVPYAALHSLCGKNIKTCNPLYISENFEIFVLGNLCPTQSEKLVYT